LTNVTIPNRPLGTDVRSIEMILADFDAVTSVINGQLDTGNMSSLGQQSVYMPGDLVITAAAGTRAGCLFCDGSAVSRTGYPALYAAIGTAFGTGDGSTTFNVPDYRGRTIVGAGVGPGLTLRTRGAQIGEEAHKLVVAEMPSHTHTFGNPAGTFGSNLQGGTGYVGQTQNTGSTGGDGTHNNVQPSTVVNVFIKT
jgi:microcystin-dependent protein